MIDLVAGTIRRYDMLAPGSRVVAAVSGGPDSVCLLHVLRELAPRIGFRLAGIAHFNHMLRPEAADDESFVAALAESMGLSFHRASADLAARPGNLEQNARRARREFFASLIRDGHSERVALGHTRDDQAETVLFRILRGSGLTGLAGILPLTAEGVIRPLIGVTREAVASYLRSHRLAWREDATNKDPRFARNRIRRQLLPRLERDWNPRIQEALAHLADLAYEEEKYWAGEVARRDPSTEMLAADLTSMPRAIARRMIRAAIRAAKGTLARLEYQHIDQVLALANGKGGGGGTLSLPGCTVTRSFDWVRFAQGEVRTIHRPVPIPVPGEGLAMDRKSLIKIELVEGDRETPLYATLKAELRRQGLPSQLELRGWKAGDRYRPVGYAREQRIKDLFQQFRVPSWRRASWPILWGKGRILWVRQFGAAAEFAADGDSGPRVRIHEIPIGEIPLGEIPIGEIPAAD